MSNSGIALSSAEKSLAALHSEGFVADRQLQSLLGETLNSYWDGHVGQSRLEHCWVDGEDHSDEQIIRRVPPKSRELVKVSIKN